MAQIKIRKYNPGGVLTTETGDTFTLEEIEQLVRENPTNENLKDIANELRAGKNVQHSISDNWSSVTDDDFRAGQKRRIAKNPNSFGRRLAATFNTQVHQYGEDVNDTTALLSAARKNASTSNEGSVAGSASVPVDEYTLISSGGGSRFVYDDNGAYVNGDFTNAKLMSLLRDLNNYFADDNGGASYKFKGISADVRKTLKEMYEANPNLFNDLMNKVQSGQIIEGSPEASLLLSIGIGSNMTKDQVEQAAKDKALKDYFVGKGFSEDQYKEFLPFVELDGQGLKLKAGIEGSPFIAGQNYYFNDDYNGVFKDLVKGQILFNNRFYDAEQLAGSGMITDWVKALREHRFADANAMIKWDWTGNQVDNYDYQLFDNQKYYNDFLNGKRYLDVTGQYEKTYDDNGNLYQIMGYYDPNDQSNYTALGFVDPSKIKYARFDSMGNLVDENYNTAFLRKSVSPWEHTSSFQGRRDDGQVEIPTITTRNGRGVLGMDVTFDPDKGTVQFHGAAVQNVLGSAGGDAIELDGEVAQILSPEFFANLEHSNKNLLGKFKDTILSLVGSKMGNTWTRNELSRREWEDLLRPTYGDQAPYYANILRNYIAEYIGRHGFLGIIGGGLSRQSRLHEFTPKHQHGGLFTGSAVAASSAPRIVQSDKYMPATTEEAGAFDFDEFTNADWMELAGLGADLASVVTGVAGQSYLSAGTGFVGTGASFMADIQRDGFQTRDLGNLGLGLLFDAASLVPFAGAASSTAKTMRALKKGLPVLMKLAGIAGIGSSLSLAVNKIQSGEELTMRDLRVIMNGVLGTYTLAKQGVDITNKQRARGAELDADLVKLHKDKIDASSLSDGQKAALKRYVDGGDYDAGLTGEQLDIYNSFKANGENEFALKLMLGTDNEVVKDILKKQQLLKAASDANAGGPALTQDQLKDYDDLVKELKLARTISPADNAKVRDLLEKEHLGTISTTEKADLDNFETNPIYRELITQYRSSFSKNAVVKDLLEKDFNETITAAEKAQLNALETDPTYKGIIEQYKALPENEWVKLDTQITSAGGQEYRPDMFNPKIDGATTIKSQADAAAVYNRKKVADDLINDSRKNYRESFDKSNAAKATKNKLSRERKKLIDEQTAVRAEKATSEAEKTRKANRLKSLDDQISKKDRQIEAQKQIIDNNSENASQYKAWRDEVVANSRDIELSSSGEVKRSTLLESDIRDIDFEFKTPSGKPLSQLEAEFNALPSKDIYENDLANRRRIGLDDIETDLAKTRKNVDDATMDSEFSGLTADEKTKVRSILDKNIKDITDEDITLLNQYTARAHGVSDADIMHAQGALKTKAQGDLAEELKDLTVGGINATLKAADLSVPVRFTELEWAKVKRSKNPKEEIKQILKKRTTPVPDKVIDQVVDYVTVKSDVEVNPEFESSWWEFRKRKAEKKKIEETPSSTAEQFKVDMEKFKQRFGSDNSLKGRILGRSDAQRDYKRRLYDMHPTDPGAAGRYYQPMVHGLHYNLMRDPIHHTPWYEPKEITIQLENEEE